MHIVIMEILFSQDNSALLLSHIGATLSCSAHQNNIFAVVVVENKILFEHLSWQNQTLSCYDLQKKRKYGEIIKTAL